MRFWIRFTGFLAWFLLPAVLAFSQTTPTTYTFSNGPGQHDVFVVGSGTPAPGYNNGFAAISTVHKQGNMTDNGSILFFVGQMYANTLTSGGSFSGPPSWFNFTLPGMVDVDGSGMGVSQNVAGNLVITKAPQPKTSEGPVTSNGPDASGGPWYEARLCITGNGTMSNGTLFYLYSEQSIRYKVVDGIAKNFHLIEGTTTLNIY